MNKKRKLLKSYKSKIRFQKLDLDQKKKQKSWKDFVTGKGSKKKVESTPVPRNSSCESCS